METQSVYELEYKIRNIISNLKDENKARAQSLERNIDENKSKLIMCLYNTTLKHIKELEQLIIK